MIIVEENVDIGTPSGQMRLHQFRPAVDPSIKFPGVIVFTEIYQVTGPIERLCRLIAAEGYIVVSPESYHEFEPAGTVLKYDVVGTDRGNELKVAKPLPNYDSDNVAIIEYLKGYSSCNESQLGCVGMCLGGHLAFRCSFLPDIKASVCLFPTDIHSHTLGLGKQDDSLRRVSEIKGELVMIFGKQDNHVPREGRDLIRKTIEDCDIKCSWIELNAQHAFIRDELSKGRYDATLARICHQLMFEVFHRVLQLQVTSNDKASGKGPEKC